MTRLVTHRAVRYGVLADAPDRFSPLLGAPAEGPAERPAAFPQRPGLLDALHGSPIAGLVLTEHAHLLRITAPADAAGLPVLFFIPGGGWVSGSGLASWYDEPALAERVVVVTVNHRIGVPGHFGPEGTPAEGARGLDDLAVALRWVHDNIARYGGDPTNVTVAGDSAGAWHAWALSTMPSVSGLIARTLLVSMPGRSPLTAEEHAARHDHVVAFLAARGLSLASAGTADLLDTQAAMMSAFAAGGLPLRPTACGELLGDLADLAVAGERFHPSALLAISTSEESSAFLRHLPDEAFTAEGNDGFLRERFAEPDRVQDWLTQTRPGASAYEVAVALQSLTGFQLPALEAVGAIAARGMPAYLVRLSAQSRLPRAGAPHCWPLPFLFGNSSTWRSAPMLEGFPADAFDRLSRTLREAVAGFMHGGRPTVDGAYIPAWDGTGPVQLELTEHGHDLRPPSELEMLTTLSTRDR